VHSVLIDENIEKEGIFEIVEQVILRGLLSVN
jgi:hypothetical protein